MCTDAVQAFHEKLEGAAVPAQKNVVVVVLEEHKVFIGRVALRFEQLNGPTHKGRPSSY